MYAMSWGCTKSERCDRQLLRDVAQDAGRGGAGVRDRGLRSDEDDPVGAVLDEGTEAPLAGEEPLLGQSLLVPQPLPLPRPVSTAGPRRASWSLFTKSAAPCSMSPTARSWPITPETMTNGTSTAAPAAAQAPGPSRTGASGDRRG